MFQFGRCPPPCLCIQHGVPPLTGWRVAPFGDRRITAWFQLPDAYRSCPRPSSALDAKASTACLFFLLPLSPVSASNAFLRPCLRIHFPSSCAWANSVKSPDTLRASRYLLLDQVCRPPSTLPQSVSSALVRGLVVMSLQLLRCTSSALIPTPSGRADARTRDAASSHANGVLTPSRWCNRQLVNIQSFPLPHSRGSGGSAWMGQRERRTRSGLLHRHIMWRCGDSNPVPPACKAGALPSELHPRWLRWWGILDSNQGPQSYQDCALTT